MTIAGVTANPISPEANDAHSRKIARAAHQFEAVLLSSLLGSLQHTFSILPGGERPRQETETYQSMGMHALAANISEQGGIGIAERIVRSLQQSESTVPENKKSPAT